MTRYKIGDIVSVNGLDGYVTDSQYIPELRANVYFVETSYFSDWFRACQLKKIHRIT